MDFTNVLIEKKSFKIASWNCNMAFRHKYKEIYNDSLDLLIIQECESPDVMSKKGFELEHNEYLWIGTNKDKGLAAISLNETKIWRDISYNDEFRYILPIRINIFDELLLCVWTQNTKNKKDSYIAQLNRAVRYYSSKYPNQKMIIIGDYNSNVTFDNMFKSRTENHSMLVSYLNANDIYSIYHHKYCEPHGLETRPTFFHHRNLA